MFLDDPVDVLLEVKADKSAGAEIEENRMRGGFGQIYSVVE